jgi:hypothetical protein
MVVRVSVSVKVRVSRVRVSRVRVNGRDVNPKSNPNPDIDYK